MGHGGRGNRPVTPDGSRAWGGARLAVASGMRDPNDITEAEEIEFHTRHARLSIAKLLARLTHEPSVPGAPTLDRREYEFLRGAGAMRELRFDTAGVRLADPNAPVIPWATRAGALRALPDVLTVAVSHARHSLHASTSTDARGALDELRARRLALPSALPSPRGWFQGCPQSGTPSCTYGDKEPLATCKYCHGAGFIEREESNASSLHELLSLFARGAGAIHRAEVVAVEAFASVGLRVDRVVWHALSERDLSYYYARGRFGSVRSTPEAAVVTTAARWASRGTARSGDEAPALRDLDALGFHLLDAAGHTVVLGVPFL